MIFNFLWHFLDVFTGLAFLICFDVAMFMLGTFWGLMGLALTFLIVTVLIEWVASQKGGDN